MAIPRPTGTRGTAKSTAWKWTLPGALPATSDARHPRVRYPEPGVYDVTLEATNRNGTAKATFQGRITVATAVDNHALRLDGHDNAVLIGMGILQPPWTHEMWIRPDDERWKPLESLIGGGLYTPREIVDPLPRAADGVQAIWMDAIPVHRRPGRTPAAEKGPDLREAARPSPTPPVRYLYFRGRGLRAIRRSAPGFREHNARRPMTNETEFLRETAATGRRGWQFRGRCDSPAGDGRQDRRHRERCGASRRRRPC